MINYSNETTSVISNLIFARRTHHYGPKQRRAFQIGEIRGSTRELKGNTISRFESSRLFTRRFPWIPDARYTRSWNFSSFMLVYCRGRLWNEMLTLAACKRTRDEISSFRGNRDSSPPPPSDFSARPHRGNFRITDFRQHIRAFDRKSFVSLVCRSINSRGMKFKASYRIRSTLGVVRCVEHNARW